MSDVPPTDRPFAYVTHRGGILLVEELAMEVDAALEDQGYHLGVEVVAALMRAFRYVTEAVAQGEADPHEDLTARVRAVLRRDRVLIGEDAAETAMRQLLLTLRHADVVGVRYYQR